MKNVVFSKTGGNITGYDRTPLPYEGSISVPVDISLTKVVEVGTQQVQKVNEDGQPLYMDEVKAGITGEVESFEETTEPTDFPVLVDEPVYETVEFEENFTAFCKDDVIEAILLEQLNQTSYQQLFAETFEFEESIDFSYNLHKANTGLGFIDVHPKGRAKTIEYALDKAVRKIKLISLEADEGIKLYVGNRLLTDELSFDTAVSKIAITIVNSTDRIRKISGFAIGY